MALQITETQAAHIAKFRGYNFRMLEATEPVVLEHNNVVFPSRWTDDECAIWRRDNNMPGKGWTPSTGLMASFRSMLPFGRWFGR